MHDALQAAPSRQNAGLDAPSSMFAADVIGQDCHAQTINRGVANSGHVLTSYARRDADNLLAASPGVTDTAGLDELFSGGEQTQGTKDYSAGLITLARVSQPEAIARSALFLASDEASFVKGVELFVDGGQVQI